MVCHTKKWNFPHTAAPVSRRRSTVKSGHTHSDLALLFSLPHPTPTDRLLIQTGTDRLLVVRHGAAARTRRGAGDRARRDCEP